MKGYILTKKGRLAYKNPKTSLTDKERVAIDFRKLSVKQRNPQYQPIWDSLVRRGYLR